MRATTRRELGPVRRRHSESLRTRGISLTKTNSCDGTRQHRWTSSRGLDNLNDATALSADNAVLRANPLRFQGFYEDANNTYNMQARSYRDDLSRFLSADRYESAAADFALQADPRTHNRYAFGAGDPVDSVEQNGHYIQNGNGDRITCAGPGCKPRTTHAHESPTTAIGAQEAYGSRSLTPAAHGYARRAAQDRQFVQSTYNDLERDLLAPPGPKSPFSASPDVEGLTARLPNCPPSNGIGMGNTVLTTDGHCLPSAQEHEGAATAAVHVGVSAAADALGEALAPAASRLASPFARLFARVPTGAEDGGQVLFRADSRGPDEIFREGFKPKGNNMDVRAHVFENPADSGFVSTSKSFAAAHDFATENGLDFIYELRGEGIDVNAHLGEMSPFPWEQEVAVPGPISPRAIAGMHRVG